VTIKQILNAVLRFCVFIVSDTQFAVALHDNGPERVKYSARFGAKQALHGYCEGSSPGYSYPAKGLKITPKTKNVAILLFRFKNNYYFCTR